MKTKLLFLLSGFICLNVFAQTQIGNDINGSVSGEFFGQSISLSSDGTRIVIGAHFNPVSGPYSGKVKVFDFDGTSWAQAGSDINSTGSYEYFGFSTTISSDGNRIALGGYGNAGYVSIYDWNGTNWIQVGSNITGEAVGDYSGYSIDLSSNGNRIAIGAIRNDGNGGDSGHVKIYNWNGSSWVQLGNNINGEFGGDQSGNAVAISSDGNRVVIGASYNDGTATYAGHARVYDWNGSDWIQVGIDLDGEAGNDSFGYAVDLSGDGHRVAIGGWYNDGNGADSGHVRVFDWNGSNWVQAGTDIDGELGNDGSGMAVALSSNGNRVAIGAWGNDGGGSSSGHVRVYDWNGSSWVKNIEDIDGETSNDNFGTSVALSSDGQTLASGAIHSDGDIADSGDVRVFDLTFEPNLVAYYPFNGYTNDESGFGNNGVPNGATLTADKNGNANSAYYFDGINDYIDLGDWENGGEMSFTFWARWDAFSNWNRIIEIGNGQRNDDIMVGSYFNSGDIAFYVNKGTTSNYVMMTAPSAITLNQWNFYSATVDVNGIMKIYKNDALLKTEESGLTPNKVLRTQQHLGRSLYPGDTYFKGAIDELRIYNRALSASELLNLYNNSALGIEDQTINALPHFYVYNNTLYLRDHVNLKDVKNMEVYNILGQQVFKTKHIEKTVSLESLKIGLYILKIDFNSSGIQTKKFIIH